ncbi:MAG: hypothetical protein ACEQSR_08890 [Candidatus Methylacidiphilales bacterium]
MFVFIKNTYFQVLLKIIFNPLFEKIIKVYNNMQILNQAEGMNTKTFTILLFAILLINACGKDCPDSKPIERGVDKSYLPYIIPYSDTSTRLFLKNGTDTLVFRSQGLNETKTVRSAGGESCDKYNLQQLSLKMAASDSDFFQINFKGDWQGVALVNININDIENTKDYSYSTFKYYLPPVYKEKILNYYYDSINVLTPENGIKELYVKPNIGILKIKLSNVTYELIK